MPGATLLPATSVVIAHCEAILRRGRLRGRLEVGVKLVRAVPRQTTPAAARQWDGVRRGCQHLAVVLVGRTDRHAQECPWHPRRCGARLLACRDRSGSVRSQINACVDPPRPGRTRCPGTPGASRSALRPAGVPAAHARAAPRSHSACGARGTFGCFAHLGGQHLPGQAGPQHEQDAGQRRPVRQMRSAALRLERLGWQQRRDCRPQCVKAGFVGRS